MSVMQFCITMELGNMLIVLLHLFHVCRVTTTTSSDKCQGPNTVTMCREGNVSGNEIDLMVDSVGAPGSHSGRCICILTTATPVEFQIQKFAPNPDSLELNVDAVTASGFDKFKNDLSTTITLSNTITYDQCRCYRIYSDVRAVQFNVACFIKEPGSSASGNNGVPIGSIAGTCTVAVVILSISIGVCLYKRKRLVSISSDAVAYNPSNSRCEVQTDRHQSRQTNQHDDTGYAGFKVASVASGHSNQDCQVEEESEYNHLNDVLVKPQLENIYSVAAATNTSDSDACHYNNLNDVRRTPAIENEYGMADSSESHYNGSNDAKRAPVIENEYGMPGSYESQGYEATDNDYEYPSVSE